MSYEVSATKYRPQTFDDLVGQEFVVSTVKNSINNQQIANAYLLSGPRGVGKTSAARIIAKALNCENGTSGSPCNQCDNCTTITKGNNNDVLEIDGASNTSINDIRVIQEEILYPPVSSKYKVYIIDEVHMLSKSAFNALLKTIEEPPKYVVFIFATTEVNKVLPTIRSRCQQFNFRLIPTDIIFNSLKIILENNQIKYQDEAVSWIASHGNGSMRDAYTLLDQIASFCNNDITLKKIEEKLGLVGEEKLLKIIKGIIEQKRDLVLLEYYSLLDSGISCEQIINDLIEFFRNILLSKANLGNKKFFDNTPKTKEISQYFSYEEIENILEILFKTYETSRYSLDIQIELEILLLKLLNYKELIRPKKILTELKQIKDLFFKENFSPIESHTTTQIQLDEKPLINIQKKNNDENTNIIKKAEKSDILNIIKSKIETTHFQLYTALNNVSFIEEKDNKMILFFSHKMYFDLVHENEDYLTNEALVVIGPNQNKNFKIIAKLNTDEKPLSQAELNLKKVKDIFQGSEI